MVLCVYQSSKVSVKQNNYLLHISCCQALTGLDRPVTSQDRLTVGHDKMSFIWRRAALPATSDPSIGTHIPDADGRGWITGTLVGIPAYLMRRLQSALNAVARLIFHLRRSDHVTDALVSLHWLRVPERIQFKIAVLTYRVLHGDAPRYLGPFTCTADVPGRRALCAAGTNQLVVSSVRLSTIGSRAFPVAAAAQIWNSLPEHIVSAPTLQSFRRHLKTFLLQQSFCL